MRQADMRKQGSMQSSQSQSRPSIPRKQTANVFPQTKAGFSQLVLKIEWGVAYLEKFRGNVVKTPQAELDLAEYFDTSRVWLEQLMQKKDKSVMMSIFEGDAVELLAHMETLCYKVELKVSSDKRRLDLVQRIQACNEIIADLGYAEQLREAKFAAMAVVEEVPEMEENPVEEVIPHLTEAAFLGSQAMAYEQVFDFEAAADTYDKTTAALRAAITVCKAVVKLKASIAAPESLIENDLLQLQRLESQTNLRSEHLKSLEPGATPIPLEEQIEPVELSIHENFWFTKKMMDAYPQVAGVSAASIGGILYMGGPFGFALLAGATVATAMVLSFANHDEGESGQEGLKKGLANIVELVSKGVRRVSVEVAKAVTQALSPRGQQEATPAMA